MKKKVSLSILACFAIILCFGVFLGTSALNSQTSILTVSAETVVSTSENTDEEQEIISEETEEGNNTFFGRVWEWVVANKTELISALGNIILAVLFLINYINSKKKLTKITSGVLTTSSSQADVVNVVNKLIDGYNKLEDITTKYANTEDEKYKAVAKSIVQTKAILEILITVYANSKNIPQGVKDLINLKYADALKLIENDEQLIQTLDNEIEKENAEEQSGTQTEE